MASAFTRAEWRRADGTSVPGLACGPVGAAGGVVCIQEWWGLDFEIKEHALHLAAAGFRVLIPDLYRGKLGSEHEEAKHLMDHLDFHGAIQDVISAAAHLRSEGTQKVGVLGFCMGGALAVGAAVKGGEAFDCVAPFYGYNVGLADVAQLKVPLQGHFGQQDHAAGFSDEATAKALEARCGKVGRDGKPNDVEVFIYPTCGHGFMNSTPEGIARKVGQGNPPHDQEAVDLAWARLEAFLAKHLTPS